MKAKLNIIALSAILLAFSQNSYAKDPNWIVRGRALVVKADARGSATNLGGNVAANSDMVPEIDITKFISPNLALELIAATTKHDISLRGSALGGSAGLGSVKLLPPTLTLQYHVNPTGTFRPYAGAGLNYTFFYGAKTGGVATQMKYQDHLGYALQAGFDYMINEKFSVNFDVKKIFLKTHVQVNNAYTASVKLDPWLIGAGVGYHF